LLNKLIEMRLMLLI